MPALIGEQHGCSFAERCTYATQECTDREIELRAGTDAGHVYRCVLTPEECARNRETGVAA